MTRTWVPGTLRDQVQRLPAATSNSVTSKFDVIGLETISVPMESVYPSWRLCIIKPESNPVRFDHHLAWLVYHANTIWKPIRNKKSWNASDYCLLYIIYLFIFSPFQNVCECILIRESYTNLFNSECCINFFQKLKTCLTIKHDFTGLAFNII